MQLLEFKGQTQLTSPTYTPAAAPPTAVYTYQPLAPKEPATSNPGPVSFWPVRCFCSDARSVVHRLRANCGSKGAQTFATHIWLYDSLNSANLIFSNPFLATFVCGPQTDMHQTLYGATSVWTVMSHFIWLLCHWNATDVAILL